MCLCIIVVMMMFWRAFIVYPVYMMNVVRMALTRNFARDEQFLGCKPFFGFWLPIEIAQSSIHFGHRTIRNRCAVYWCMVIFWHVFYHNMLGNFFVCTLLRILVCQPKWISNELDIFGDIPHVRLFLGTMKFGFVRWF